MKNTQAFRIGQTSAKSSDRKEYYNWQIWIEDGDLSLGEVEKVEYLLHPTFPNRLRTSTDRAEKFKMKSSGWGEFMIKILVYVKSGKTYSFSHWLTLGDAYNNLEQTSSEAKKPKRVFLSYANADARLAKELEHRLTEIGVEVNSPSVTKPGSKIKDSIEDAIRASDAVIAIEPQYKDHWLNVELDIAKQASVKIVPILNTKRKLSSNLKGLQHLSIDDTFNEESIKSITNSINNL